ncbi:sperm-associated antigen 4 protein-like isoform X2 [Larus michahellis]|uniref:sperm-associated antigen 4 protein-like isoform X2 n=1 Tax=Larus michahellis TaxID=119627 RepID=UPI003D9B9256
MWTEIVFLLDAALSVLCQQQASKTVSVWPEKGNPPVKGFVQGLDHDSTRTPSFSGKRWPCRRRRSCKSSCCSPWLLEVEEMKQAASERALEAYVEMSDWALQSSGASIDLQRTSETYTCKNDWFWRFIEFFCTPRGPDRILQPDVSPGNCWAFPGHQGQVVIRLPARVHLTAITVQHISKEVSPSGTVTSAPRDIAVFGVDVDGEEETLLVTFMYDVAKEAIQTFPLKNAPHPRAFSYLKLLVKSNWGKPKYTCIYRVQVHGKMAKPNSLN